MGDLLRGLTRVLLAKFSVWDDVIVGRPAGCESYPVGARFACLGEGWDALRVSLTGTRHSTIYC